MKANKELLTRIIETSSVLAVSLSMALYGIGKIVQFKGSYNDNINKLVSELSGMELMWTFYGYSQSFPILIGIIETLGALLLLIKKTRLIGALLLSFILINIIIQDIIYDIPALFSASFYQLLILVIIWINKDVFLSSINAILINKNIKNNNLIVIYSASFIVFILLKFLELKIF